MTDKEFKRLSRPQLIDIMYQLQLKVEELTEENRKLKEELEDKRIRVRRAGNIAEAALEINNVMQAAQNAAEQYLGEICMIRTETEAACQRMLAEAQREADEIVNKAQRHSTYDSAGEMILNENRQNQQSDGEWK